MLLGILVCVGAIISKWFYMLIPTDGSRMSADIVRSSNTNLRIATQATRGSSPFTEQVTVTKEGRVGIGTSNPAQTLDVNGAVAIRGGGAGPGKVLTSTDIYGNATWQAPAAGGGGLQYLGECTATGYFYPNSNTCSCPLAATYLFVSSVMSGNNALTLCAVVNQGVVGGAYGSVGVVNGVCRFSCFK